MSEIKTNIYLEMSLTVYQTNQVYHPNYIKYDSDGVALGGFIDGDGAKTSDYKLGYTPWGEFMTFEDKNPDANRYLNIGKVFFAPEFKAMDIPMIEPLAATYGLSVGWGESASSSDVVIWTVNDPITERVIELKSLDVDAAAPVI